MKNILSIYKLNLPFGEGSLYDKTRYRSVCQELEFFLKYEGIFISEKIEKYKEFEVTELEFTGGMIKVIFYYETHHYFLPSFQTDVLTNIHLSDKFFQSFYSIFTSLGGHDYVFDLITEKINLPDSRIVTDKELSKSFQSFSFKSLNAFLEKLDPMFIDEKLDQNPLMRKHLYYLIFLNYKLFKNILFMEGGILELEELIGEDIDDNLKTELSFSRERITHVEKTNIQVFNKYKIMLEKLINLMLKK